MAAIPIPGDPSTDPGPWLTMPAPAPPAPLSCDLPGDPLACAILSAWARQPWQQAHRNALTDRMIETGRTEEEMAWIREQGPPWRQWMASHGQTPPRRAV